MKKELILLACMTAAPYLLSSAGKREDTAASNTLKDTLNYPVLSSLDPMGYRFDMPDEYKKSQERFFTTYVPDSGAHSISIAPLSGALLERKQTKVKSSIRANWVLDTAASQHSSALVYMDKDNPGLKAVIFTDNAGNMLMRLEQDGKYHEIRVKKIEFHVSVGFKSRKQPFNKLLRSNVALNYNEKKETIMGIRKGVGCVPV